jgi:hypothetical protein
MAFSASDFVDGITQAAVRLGLCSNEEIPLDDLEELEHLVVTRMEGLAKPAQLIVVVDDNGECPAMWSDRPIKAGIIRHGRDLQDHDGASVFKAPTITGTHEDVVGHLVDAATHPALVTSVLQSIKAQSKVALFELGRTVATPGALNLLKRAGVTTFALLGRHHAGDWGDVTTDSRDANARALAEGDRLMSVYDIASLGKVYVITEHDRSVTTILEPSDY